MKKRIAIILVLMISLCFTACSSAKEEIDGTELYQAAIDKMLQLEALHLKTNNSAVITYSGEDITFLNGGEAWIRNGKDFSNTELYSESYLTHNGEVVYFTDYVSGGKLYTVFGDSKSVYDELEYEKVIVESYVPYDLLPFRDIIVNPVAVKVSSGYEITFEIDHEKLLDVLGTSFRAIIGDNIELGSSNGSGFINSDGIISSMDIELNLTSELSGSPMEIKITISSRNEILPASYEFQFPDFSDFTE